ncbi:IS3 family transposase [Streptomyces sp. NPDC016734]|uniref:IS3 family transposase n=1 Tax=Streptomyces TaxID=1883 RepID=UPI00099C77E5
MRQVADARLAARIRTVHQESDGTYGVPRITTELRDDGEPVNHKRVACVMRSINLAGLVTLLALWLVDGASGDAGGWSGLRIRRWRACRPRRPRR